VLGRNRPTAREPAVRDGLAQVEVLILMFLVVMSITIGIPILVIRVVAPLSGGRTLAADAKAASSPQPHNEVAVLSRDGHWTISETSTLRMAFSVRNVGFGTRTFRWIVTTHATGRAPIVAASGHLNLSDGASRTVGLRVRVSCRARRLRVGVSLGGADKAIGAWLPCRPPRVAPIAAPTLVTLVNPTRPATRQHDGMVRFTVKIDNHTGSSQRYRYVATTQAPGHPPVEVATGSFALDTAHYADLRLQIRDVCVGARSRITTSVGIASPGGATETVGFWVPCRANRT
jgi:hypothetical protein